MCACAFGRSHTRKCASSCAGMCLCIYVCMCICLCVCVFVCLCVCLSACLSVRLRGRASICLCAGVRASVRACVCGYACIPCASTLWQDYFPKQFSVWCNQLHKLIPPRMFLCNGVRKARSCLCNGTAGRGLVLGSRLAGNARFQETA